MRTPTTGSRSTVWRDHHAPDKAVQFGNLFSRLLTLPILNRKREIILLLDRLADPGSEDRTFDASEGWVSRIGGLFGMPLNSMSNHHTHGCISIVGRVVFPVISMWLDRRVGRYFGWLNAVKRRSGI